MLNIPPGGAAREAAGHHVFRRVVTILLLGVVVGAVGSLLAVAFVEAVDWLELGRSRFASDGFSMFLLLLPVAGGLVVGVMMMLTERKSPHGIADIVETVQIGGNEFSLRNGFVNAIAAVVGMGSGASIGPYGPLASIGASLGTVLTRWSRADLPLAVGCGVAAMISTAFCAPIAAVVFVHEVVLRHYSLRAFAPITVASSTGYFASAYLLGRQPLFEMHAHRSLFAPEFLVFVVIGIVSALVATVFMAAVIRCSELAQRSSLPNWLKPAIAGLGVGLMAQWLPEVMGTGKQLLTDTIGGTGFDLWQLVLLLPLKILATALCIGFGFSGGTFSPSLVIGVIAGALLGLLAATLFGDHASGVAFYSICGMMAVASPVIGGPLTAILIVFELTRNYELTTAVMISVVFSNVVAYRLFGRSLFDRQLNLKGIDFSLGRDKVVLERTPIATHVTTDAVVVQGKLSLDEAKRQMLAAGRQECAVLDELSHYIGKLRLADVLPLEQRLDPIREVAADHADKDALVLPHELSVWQALIRMREFVGESIPIIDRRGFYIGVIYQSTLVTAYLDTSSSLRAEEHSAG